MLLQLSGGHQLDSRGEKMVIRRVNVNSPKSFKTLLRDTKTGKPIYLREIVISYPTMERTNPLNPHTTRRINPSTPIKVKLFNYAKLKQHSLSLTGSRRNAERWIHMQTRMSKDYYTKGKGKDIIRE